MFLLTGKLGIYWENVNGDKIYIVNAVHSHPFFNITKASTFKSYDLYTTDDRVIECVDQRFILGKCIMKLPKNPAG